MMSEQDGATGVAEDMHEAPPRTQASRRIWIWSLLLLLVGSSALALLGNGAERGLDRSETYIARVPTEMWRRDTLIVPYYNDLLRLQKPPINYWLSMGSHHVFDDSSTDIVSEFAARFPAAASSIALVFVTVWLGVLTFQDRRVGIAAGALFATTVAFLTGAHNARPEALYALFCGVMTVGCVGALRKIDLGESSLRWAVLGWVGFIGAVLSKGPHIPALMGIGFLIAMFVRRRPRDILRAFKPWVGLLVIPLLGLPWFIAIAIVEPTAWDFWIHEMFDRTGEPSQFWLNALELYYVKNTIGHATPWFLLLFGALLLPWRRKDEIGDRAMTLWMGVVATLFVMGFSAYMRAQYILPVMPLLCVLMAGEAVTLFDRWGATARGRMHLRNWHVVQSVIIIVMGVAIGVVISREGVRFSALSDAMATAVMWGLITLATALAVVGVSLARRKPAAGYGATVMAAAAVFLAVDITGLGWSGPRRTRADLGKRIAQEVPRETPLYAAFSDPAVSVYYADRAILELKSPEALLEKIMTEPNALFIVEKRELKQHGIVGEIVIAEEDTGHNSPMIVYRNLQPAPIRTAYGMDDDE